MVNNPRPNGRGDGQNSALPPPITLVPDMQLVRLPVQSIPPGYDQPALTPTTAPHAEQGRVYEDAPSHPYRARGFGFVELDDLLAEPEMEIDWLVEGMMPRGGVSIMAARPKVGKSTLARNLALSVARGEKFLYRKTHQGKVLYMALEEQRGDVASKFRKMGASRVPIRIHTGAAPENALEALTQAVLDYQPALAVIDPLIRFARIKDVNDYAEVYRVMGPIVDLARQTGCHILLLHHTNKMVTEGTMAVMGSVGFTGAVDTTFVLHRSYETNQRTVMTEQRTGEDLPPTVLQMDPDTEIITPLGEVNELAIVDAMRKIVEYLRERGEACTQQDIRDNAGCDTSKVPHALRRLYDDENIARSGTGRKGDPFLFSCFSLYKGKTRKQESSLINIGSQEKQENPIKPLKPEKQENHENLEKQVNDYMANREQNLRNLGIVRSDEDDDVPF